MSEEYGSWEAEGFGAVIRYQKAAMDSVRQAALAGLQKIPKRGLEVGGILFGRRDGQEIRIEQWREIACEHAQGPGFHLSERDLEGLEQTLADAADDPHLEKLEAVGWFRSRTRGGVTLTEQDIEICDRFFPAAWQVALVVRPFMYEPAQAGFFFREKDGKIRGEASRGEFLLDQPRRRLALGFDPAQPPARRGEMPAGYWPEAAEPASSSTARSERSPVRDGSRAVPPGLTPSGLRSLLRWRRSYMVAAMVLALAVVLSVPAFVSKGDEGLDLRARNVDGQLLIEWNRNASPLAEGAKTLLRIRDGERQWELDMKPEDLRSGTLTYIPQGGDVEIEFTVESAGASPLRETTRVTGVRRNPAGATSVAEGTGTSVLDEEVRRLRDDLDSETRRATALREEIDAGLAAARQPSPARR